MTREDFIPTKEEIEDFRHRPIEFPKIVIIKPSWFSGTDEEFLDRLMPNRQTCHSMEDIASKFGVA